MNLPVENESKAETESLPMFFGERIPYVSSLLGNYIALSQKAKALELENQRLKEMILSKRG
jgi:hypothetical protein